MKKSTMWPELIKYAEEKLQRTRLRGAQLEALLGMFRANYKAGEPCPVDVAKVSQSQKMRKKRLSKD